MNASSIFGVDRSLNVFHYLQEELKFFTKVKVQLFVHSFDSKEKGRDYP